MHRVALQTWLCAFLLAMQALVVPWAGPSTPTLASEDASCCEEACCCGDTDVCLCVAEVPSRPQEPTRESVPARPSTSTELAAVLPGTEAAIPAITAAPSLGPIRGTKPRAASRVRVHVLHGIWLT